MIVAVSGTPRGSVQAVTGDIRFPMGRVWSALPQLLRAHQQTLYVPTGITLCVFPAPSGPTSTTQVSAQLSMITVILGINTMEPA